MELPPLILQKSEGGSFFTVTVEFTNSVSTQNYLYRL